MKKKQHLGNLVPLSSQDLNTLRSIPEDDGTGSDEHATLSLVDFDETVSALTEAQKAVTPLADPREELPKPHIEGREHTSLSKEISEQTLPPDHEHLPETQEFLEVVLEKTHPHSQPIRERSEKLRAHWGELIGQTLGGCKLESILGAGGMGVVFLGHHLTLDIKVAVKCLPPHAATQDARERFALEARAAAKLNHPHVVSVFHAGEERGLHFIVMELIEGESVEDKLKRRGTLSVEEALGYCLDICSALDYAERQGITHRDLKPANILVNRDGAAKLADLGLVKQRETRQDQGINGSVLQGELTMQGVAMGTPHYIAPEQILDATSVDKRADLYSLGCTLFHMVTGEPMFHSTQLNKLLNAHLKAERPRADEIVDHLPIGLTELILKMVAIDPLDRPNDAKSLEREILTLFDSWATLPAPIHLSSHRRRQRMTYHVRSLDEERAKTRRLSQVTFLLVVALAVSVCMIFFGKELDQLNTDQAVQTSSKLEHASLKADQSLHLAYQTQREFDDMYARLSAGDFRIIQNPTLPVQHLVNGLIHHQLGHWSDAIRSLTQALKNGLGQLDVVELLWDTLAQTRGAEHAREEFKRLRQKYPLPSVNHILAFHEADPVLQRSRLQATCHRAPSYLPDCLLLLDLLDREHHSGVLPLLEKYQQYVQIAKSVKPLYQSVENTLSKFYFDPNRRKQLRRNFAKHQNRHHVLEQITREPISVQYAILSNHLLMTLFPKGHLYSLIKSIKTVAIPSSEVSLPLPIQQAELRGAIANYHFADQRLTPGETLIQNITLDHDFNGVVISELTDLHDLKSYVVTEVNVQGIVLTNLERLFDPEQSISSFKMLGTMLVVQQFGAHTNVVCVLSFRDSYASLIQHVSLALKDEEGTIDWQTTIAEADPPSATYQFNGTQERFLELNPGLTIIVTLKSGQVIERKIDAHELILQHH